MSATDTLYQIDTAYAATVGKITKKTPSSASKSLKTLFNTKKKEHMKAMLDKISAIDPKKDVHKKAHDEWQALPLLARQVITLHFFVMTFKKKEGDIKDFAAMVGNLTHESVNLNPSVVEFGGKASMSGGFGLAQWTNWPRFAKLFKFAISKFGTSPAALVNPMVQLAWISLFEGGTETNWLAVSRQKVSLYDKTLKICKDWERPANPYASIDERVKYATNALGGYLKYLETPEKFVDVDSYIKKHLI